MRLGDGIQTEQDIRVVTSNGDWQVGGNTSGPSGTRRFYIYDGLSSLYPLAVDSASRVLTPYQPAYATTGTNYTQTSGGNSKIIASSETFDIGSNYNLASGRFTAPVAGTYLFGFSGLSYPQGATDVSDFRWYKNGSGFGDNVQFGGNSTNHVLCAGSIQMNLSASDYVELYMFGAGGAKAYGSQWHMWGRFCG